MAEVTFRIQRCDPEQDGKPYFKEYGFDVPEGFTLLDSLNHIKAYIDDSLTYRFSCRSSICGSCGMRVNGHAKLTCMTQVVDVLRPDGSITIEPQGNQTIQRDLMVDTSLFWEKMRAVKPWLEPDPKKGVPEKEYRQDPAVFNSFVEESTCIMCGNCVSDCTSLEQDANFRGPAALAKAWRFVADDRGGDQQQRLEMLVEDGGIWDCVRCNECVEVCPKTVAPMEAILKLRQAALERGLTNSIGARHVTVFTDSVTRAGVLDEKELPAKSLGVGNLGKLIGALPLAFTGMVKGKISPLPHKPIPGTEDLQRIRREIEKEATE